MYKINILVNYDKYKFITLIKSQGDLIINNKNEEYIITTYIQEKDFYNLKDKNKKIWVSETRKHSIIFPLRCIIENDNEGCRLVGKFHFNLAIKFYLTAFNSMFIYIIFNFLSPIFIPLIIFVISLSFWLNYIHLKNVKYIKNIMLSRFMKIAKEADLYIEIKEDGVFSKKRN